MRLLTLIAFSLCASCVSNPDAEAHRLALWNFSYQSDIADEWKVYDRIDQPFSGDCEDFSLSLQKQIGGDVWYVILPDGTAHAALVKNDIVYDNINRRPIGVTDYRGQFIKIMSNNKEPSGVARYEWTVSK